MVVAAYTEGWIAVFGPCCWCRHTPQCACGNKGVSKAHPSSQSHVVVMCVVLGVMGWVVGAVPCLPPPRVVPAVLGWSRQSLLVQSVLQSSCLEGFWWIDV